MMLKSMRDATSSIGDSITGGHEMELYQSMYDQQIATYMAKGKGLGLADLLVQQLSHSGAVRGPAGANGTAIPTTELKAVQDAAKQEQPVGHSPQPVINESSKSLKPNHDKSIGRVRPLHTTQLTPNVDQKKAASINATQASAQATAKISSPAEFVQRMWPHAQRAAQKLGVDPTTLIAHAALETGWGKHVPCHDDGSSSHNLFGIKAGSSWNGQSIGSSTLEFEQGVAVKRVERFKAYDSPEQCFADYAALLSKYPRYGETLNAGSNTAKFAQGLQKGGYATDPDYAHKLKAVAHNVMSLVSSLTNHSSAQYAAVSRVPSVSQADRGKADT